MTIFLIIVLILLIYNPEISANAVISTCNLWIAKLVPVLLPTIIISEFISNSKIINMLSIFLFPIFKFIFNIRYINSVNIIILSIICGAPASTKIVCNAVNNFEIDSKEAISLLYSFSFLSISYTIFVLTEINISILLYFTLTFLSSIIIMRLFNSGKVNKNKKVFNKKNNIDVFLTSISKTSTTLISILIIMICFNVILSLFLKNNNLYCLFETLNGHQILFESKTKYKKFLAAFSLAFLGFSLHLQILYVYNKINYKKFLLVKILQALFISWLFLI